MELIILIDYIIKDNSNYGCNEMIELGKCGGGGEGARMMVSRIT